MCMFGSFACVRGTIQTIMQSYTRRHGFVVNVCLSDEQTKIVIEN